MEEEKYIKVTNKIGERNRKTYFYEIFSSDNFAVIPKTPIMELKQSGDIDDVDVDMIDFVYRSRFCSKSQLERYCKYKGYENVENRIWNLLGSGIINSFFLSRINPRNAAVHKPADAKTFYCLKIGGKYILEEFSDRRFVDWEAGNNITQIKNIENQEIFNEILLDIMTSGVKITNSWMHPEYSLREKRGKPLGHLGITRTTEKEKEYLIFDVIRMEDNPDDVQRKILLWEEYLVKNKSWMKIFGASKKLPTLVLITDNDESAMSLARSIGDSTQLNILLLTTFDRIENKKLNDVGKFLKYNRDDKTLYEVSYNLFS